MADEHEFIENGLQRSQIDEFFATELERAGYGGMEIAKTPMGTQIVLRAEKPGMVIGKGGKNIRKITQELGERFDLDDPQIDVQEVDEPDLNAQIVADRLGNALERGWYFRKAGHTTIDRIMESGALGAEIVLAGKVTGARSRVEKFNRGYIKHNGEPAEDVVDSGQGTAVMKLGTIGVNVKIIPPGAQLPDDFRIEDDADVEDLIADTADTDEGVEEILDEVDEEVDDETVEGRGVAEDSDAAERGAAEMPEQTTDTGVEEEFIEEPQEASDEELVEETGTTDEEVVEEVAEEVADGESQEAEELDEEVESEAEELVAEMEEENEGEEQGGEE